MSQPGSTKSRDLKRKQPLPADPGLEPSSDPDHKANKRQRTPSTSTAAAAAAAAAATIQIRSGPPTSTGAPVRAIQIDPVGVWVTEGRWPNEQCWPKLEENSKKEAAFERLLARKRYSPALSGERSNACLSMTLSDQTPSDQRPREEKSAPYQTPQYPFLLETKGSYMSKSPLDITDQSKRLCETLLNSEQPVPKESLFDEDIFESVCETLGGSNEARVIQDISRLIVPSAEQCALRAGHLKPLIESVNEGWNNSIPLIGTRPQPDYSVGFRRDAFTADQLTKLSPFVGDTFSGDLSLFMATFYMYFPFLTCEVKCSTTSLQVADCQNAHSMTLAVRAVVELFGAVKREDEIHRQILAFSISHDNQCVRIYGHYPVIDGENTKYYRYPIHSLDLIALDGKEKWTAYRFTKNVYHIWMPKHFKWICSAIDQLPAVSDSGAPSLSQTGRSQSV
ncbi:hypothetical protein B0J18DRAFT_488551 [Chaetomium sp. MPI-SDFR-AT-0129]|nr:hypothetical protein B0J18DRAFT_488551 [Chaetomium sp. MPI-SDFR-AT-0129]